MTEHRLTETYQDHKSGNILGDQVYWYIAMPSSDIGEMDRGWTERDSGGLEAKGPGLIGKEGGIGGTENVAELAILGFSSSMSSAVNRSPFFSSSQDFI